MPYDAPTPKYPRAPRGYRTMPDGTVLKVATFAPYAICKQSNRRVTETQRRRGNHDCPRCGAPDITWYREVSPTDQYWTKHRLNVSDTQPQLDGLETGKTGYDGTIIEENDADAPF